VISGINWGSNLGTDVFYSGTVSAAMEGSLEGLPSLAVSLATRHEHPDFQPGAAFIATLVEYLPTCPLAPPYLLNLNLPIDTALSLELVRFVRLGHRRYQDLFEKRSDPRGRVYYWLAGTVIAEEADLSTDIGALAQQFIPLTPLHCDLGSPENLRTLQNKGWWSKG